MRIAIPVSGDCLEQHFGHCERFVILDISPGTGQVTATREVPAPEHQPGLLPPWLREQGVTLVIAGGMGVHARSLLQENSIEVITGAPSQNAAALVRLYLEGGLTTTERTCDHVCNH